jgi:hypothetical protein
MVKKENEQSKDVNITKTFKYSPQPENVINHIFKYYKINCQSEYNILIKDKSSGNYNAKETNLILAQIGQKEYLPKVQIIDARYKCKFVVTFGGYIIPTIPSGTIYNINISNNLDNHIQDYSITYKYLNEIIV